MSKFYELAEQAAEYAVLNPSEVNLESEVDERSVSIPKEFIDQFGTTIIEEVFNWISINVGLMGESELDSLKKHFGI